MEDPQAHRVWDTALGQLQLQVTRPNFDTWLKDTVGLRTENGSFIVGTPSDFVSEWLSAKMGPIPGGLGGPPCVSLRGASRNGRLTGADGGNLATGRQDGQGGYDKRAGEMSPLSSLSTAGPKATPARHR